MSLSAIIISAIIIAIPLIVTLVPLIVGEVKKRRVIKPVEYVPPRGASPVDFLINYYGASVEPREIFNPIMLHWAARGFITIEEDCKRGLKLTKLKDLQPPEEEDGFNPKTFELEKKLFDKLFYGKCKTVYTLTEGSSFKDLYRELTDSCAKLAKKITDYKSKKYKIISLVAAFASMIAVIITVGVAIHDNAVIACIFPFTAIAFPKLVLSIPVDPKNDGIPKGSAARFMLFPFCLLFGAVPFMMILYMAPVSAIIVLVASFAAGIIVVFFLCEKIDIRDNEDLAVYARICGFKHFLLFAEIKQLEMLVEEDPNYYYNILPYCYILKITKKLKPKFDRIALDGPAWYLGELRETLMF